jgi:glycosyltransferase involved in cell wall biosynthesis
MEKISIIAPVYQVEKYIGQCIESVINQTFKNFELILIDDGSKDKSGNICDEYAKRDKRIHVVHTENKGAASARNKGLDLATGKYIAFVDGDDYLAENMLDKLYKVITQENCDVVVCDFLNLHANSDKDFSLQLSDSKVSGREILSHLKNQKNYGVWTIVWNKLYKKEILKDLRFPEGKYFEDEIFSDQLYLICNEVQVISDVLYYHRVLETSTMNTQKIRNYLDLIDAFQLRINLYLENRLPDDEVYKVLIYMLEPYTKCAKADFMGNDKERLKQAKRFIRKSSRILIKKRLSFIKKGSLILIAFFPVFTYQIAILFRDKLEKFL